MLLSLSVIFCRCCMTVGRKQKHVSPKAGDEKVAQTVMVKERPSRGGRRGLGRGRGRGHGWLTRCLLIYCLIVAYFLALMKYPFF